MKPRSVSILHKLHNRQLCGRVAETVRPNAPAVRLCEPRQPWFHVPLKNIVDNHQALLKGHVLLGFLKDGIHLISYLCQVESTEDILHSRYTYSLYIWRFDLGKPLIKVCMYPLFVGETINSDLQLVICETAWCDHIVVLGAGVRGEETSRQHFVSIFPSPQTVIQSQSMMNNTDAFFVHFRYDVQPPYPPFSPLLSLKIKDTLICNTGDTLTTITVQTHDSHTEYSGVSSVGSLMSPCSPTSPASITSSSGESDAVVTVVTVSESDAPNKKGKYQCRCPNLRSSEHHTSCPVSRMESVRVATDCDLPLLSPFTQSRKRFTSRLSSQSPKIQGERKTGQVESVTTFSCRMYGLCHNTTSDGRYDAVQSLYPLRASSLAHGPLRLTHTEVSEYHKKFKPPLQDDFVTVKQVSFDAELYLNGAVPLYEDLAARYLSLRDYDMRVLDVCEGTNSVLILIMLLCVGKDETQKHKQVLLSSGFILSWNITTGKAQTLEFLQIEEFSATPFTQKIWKPGQAKSLELRKQWFTPTSYHRCVRAFSNASVFSGVSLTKLQHPYLPVAIIL